jgi:hypothetical protein
MDAFALARFQAKREFNLRGVLYLVSTILNTASNVELSADYGKASNEIVDIERDGTGE